MSDADLCSFADSLSPDNDPPGAATLTKERVTVRLDRDVLAFFRSKGRGYQTRLNAALKAYVEAEGATGRPHGPAHGPAHGQSPR